MQDGVCKWLASAEPALLVVACGGSGDGGTPKPSAPAAPPPATTAAVTVTAVDSFGVALADASVTVPGTTDAAGRTTLNVPFAAAVNVKVGKAGYADEFEVISVPTGTLSPGVAALLRALRPE